MAYDSQRGVTVLFGGQNAGAGNYSNETWEWDGNSWTNVSPTTRPTLRFQHAMAYDSQRGVTVLFGGYDANFNDLSDTWEWNGTTWTQVATTGPTARRQHTMAYDSQRGVSVVFGGFTGFFNPLGDTWEWDGTSWTQVASTGPSARNGHAMAYDSQRGRTVLFGGEGLGDTWEWNGTSWSQVATTGPSARYAHAIAYDHSRAATVLFGGWDSGGVNGETWDWNGTVWTQRTPTSSPSPRFLHKMAYDSRRGKTVMFGGADTILHADTWEAFPSWPSGVAIYGAGCGNPQLSFVPINTPIAGKTGSALLAFAPVNLGYVALGFSNTVYNGIPLPLDLASLGLPGCLQLQSSDAIGLPVLAAGPGNATVQFNLAIPDSVIWWDVTLYLQAIAPAPGANPAEHIVSNGIEWTIGNF